jgi:hypothetical protein
VTNRDRHLERHQRYNRSEKGRARGARYRKKHPDRLAETRARDNASRIFIGSHYVAREGRFPYPREVIEQHLGRLDSDFRKGQAEAHAAFRESLRDAESPSSMIELLDLLKELRSID